MLDVKLASAIAVFVYTFLTFIQLLLKSYFNKKKVLGFDFFNHVLIIFLSLTAVKIFGLFVINANNVNEPLTIFVVRLYLFLLFYFIYILVVYICRNVMYCDIKLVPGHNAISNFLLFEYVAAIVLIFSLPITILYDDGVFWARGPAFTFSYLLGGSTYLLVIYNFLKNYKQIDIFKAFGPIFFPVLFVGSYILELNYHFSSIELLFTLMLLITYFGVEKREEKMQKELISTALELGKAARFKTDFLSSMSHEIKTPLNSIVASSRNLINNPNINYSTKSSINDILYSSDVLKETVSNILIVSKIEAQKMTVNEIAYDIREQLKTLPFNEKVSLDTFDINFFMSIDDEVPKLLYGADELLRIITDNTLTYVLSHTNSGSLTLKVGWSEEESGSKLIITVENIENNTLDLFKNIENLSVDIYDCYDNEEFGLGVANILCKRLQGEISHEHFDDRNVITYKIPQKKYHSDVDFDAITYKGKKALVVDDVELNLKVAGKILTDLGFTCTYLKSGFEAIDLIKDKKDDFDIIFLDIMMPNMGGEETLNKLKEIQGFNVPVVALTADDVGNAKDKYLSSGFKGYVIKPFSKIDLINELERIFGGDK